MIWDLIAVVIVSFALSYTQAKKAQKKAKKLADAMKGVLVNKESNVEPIPVIYGARRVGGTRVFVHTAGGDKNKYLYICLVLCEGEVDSIYDIKIDDYKISDSRFRKDGRNLISVDAKTGTDNQQASNVLLGATGKWTSAHRLQGIAYLGLRLEWNEDVFSGIPEVTAVVRGKRVRDPRYPSAAPAWSDNPALCLYDYLTNKRYGKGLGNSVIDLEAFKAAATFCDRSTVRVSADENVTDSERIFRCNAVIDTGNQLFENVQTMLLGMRGFLPYTNGAYSLRIDQKAVAIMTIGPSQIVGGIGIAGESKKDRFNRVLVKFPNPKAEWQPDQAVYPEAGSAEERSYLTFDGGELLVDEIDMETITSFYAARDFARIFLLRSRNSLRVQITATSEALDLVPGDVITVNHPTPGWSGSLKPFQVEEMSLNFDGTVDLQLIEYDPSIYTYQAGPTEPEYPDTDLADPFDVDPPTLVNVVESTEIASDGSLIIALDVTWTASINSFVTYYEIGWYQKETEGVVFTDTLGYTASTTPGTSYRITNIEEKAIIIGVRAVSTVGARSEWAYKIYDPEGDNTAPDAPTNASANGEFGQITLSWVNPTQPDFHYIEVQVNKVFDDAATPAVEGPVYEPLTTVPAPSNTFIHTGLLPAEKRSYRIRSVDYSSNPSGWVVIDPATTTFIDDSQFTEGVKDLFDEAGLYAIQPYATLDDAPETGEELGKLIYIRDEGKLYEWKGDEEGWKPVVPDIGDLIGTLPDTVVIGDDQISSPMIKAGEIQAYLINAGGIKASEINTDSLKAGLAQVSGLIANSAMISDTVITNAKIENAAVSTFKIGNNAVTIPAFEVYYPNANGVEQDIPDVDRAPYPGLANHPDNWLTVGVLDFSWGRDADEQEIEDNEYSAVVPPARITVLGDTFFFARQDDGSRTATSRIIAVEGDTPSLYKSGSNPDRWTWNIREFVEYSTFTSLPATATPGAQAYVQQYQRLYVYSGGRWVQDRTSQSGEIIITYIQYPGFSGTVTVYQRIVKFNALTGRYVSGGIINIGRGATSVLNNYSAQVSVTGFIDTSGIVANSVKFVLQMQTNYYADGNINTPKHAGRASLLALGTKK